LNPFWSNIFRKAAEAESLPYFLGTIPIFAELNKKDLALIESLVHVRHYTAGETVFTEGDVGSGMYMIRSGRVVITCRDSRQREHELAQLGPGDFFGETTLTAPKPRTATARTVGATELIGLFRADLLDATQKNPAACARLLLGLSRTVSERLQVASQQLLQQQLGDDDRS